jgi:hypothetical protein
MSAASTLPKGVKRQYPASEYWGPTNGLNGRAQANDYFSNSAARMGWGTPSLSEATEYELVRLSYDYPLLYTLYRNHWISRRIVDAPAQDMVRAWPRLTSEIDPKDLTRIDRALRDTKTKQQTLKALKWARLFGGAGALIIIDGQENQLDQPLDLDSIEIGAYRGLIPFDRWTGIQPDSEISTDFRKPKEFNLPRSYRVGAPNGSESFEVHSSRILRFCGPSVPTPEYQAQMYWGISVLEPAFEEIRKRDNMSWNILSLTFRANLISLNFDELAQALSGAGMSQGALQDFYARMQAMNSLMSNQNMVILPKDGKLESTQYGFAGLADVYQQFQLDIAGAAQIPVTRLFGRTLTGLGQSNDADETIYEQYIALEQSDQMEPQLDTLYRVIAMSTLGEIPEDLDLQFPSVRVLDEKEKADLAKATGENVIAAFGAGLINLPQGMRELKQSSALTGIFTNITDEEIEEAEEQQKLDETLGISAAPGESAKEDAGEIEKEAGRFEDSALLEIESRPTPLQRAHAQSRNPSSNAAEKRQKQKQP